MKPIRDLFTPQVRRIVLVWGGILAVYFALALAGLSHQDLDQDELITSSVIRRFPLLALIRDRFQEGHPPLYFLSLKVWLAMFGHTSLNLHLFSVLLGALAVLAMGLLARELGLSGYWPALASLMWALHPTLQFYARYVRPMIGVLLFGTLAMWITARALRTGAQKDWRMLFIIGLLGAIWNHMIALVWIAMAIVIALTPQWRKQARYWRALAVILPVHLCSLLGVVWASSYDDDPMEWIQKPRGFEYITPYLDVIGGWTGDSLILTMLAIAILIALVVALVQIGRLGENTLYWRLVAASTVFPAIVFISGTVLVKPMLVPRYMIVMVPGAALLIVWLLSRIKNPRLGRTCAVCMAILMLAGSPRSIARHETGLRESVRKLERRLQRGDKVVVFNNMTAEGVMLHARRRIKTIDCHTSRNDYMTRLERKLAGASRVWLIEYRNRAEPTTTPNWSRIAGKQLFCENAQQVRLLAYELKQPPPAQSK